MQRHVFSVMTDVSESGMPTDYNYSRQNTSDSCASIGKSDAMSDAVSVTVSGSSPSNSLDRSLCGSLGADDVASCAAGEECSTSAADADERALLEKLQHANRCVVHLIKLHQVTSDDYTLFYGNFCYSANAV